MTPKKPEDHNQAMGPNSEHDEDQGTTAESILNRLIEDARSLGTTQPKTQPGVPQVGVMHMGTDQRYEAQARRLLAGTADTPLSLEEHRNILQSLEHVDRVAADMRHEQGKIDVLKADTRRILAKLKAK